jgi:antitoxin HigA-1
MPRTKAPTDDALEILDRRYYAGNPRRQAGLQRAREELVLEDERERVREQEARQREGYRRKPVKRGEFLPAHALDLRFDAGKDMTPYLDLKRGRRPATDPCPLDVLQDILGLVDEKVTLKWLRQRTQAERDELLTWVSKVHARASDHPVRVPPKPKCLRSLRTLEAIDAIHAHIKKTGFKITKKEIDAEIAAARQDRATRSRTAATAGNLAVPAAQLRDLLAEEMPLPGHRVPTHRVSTHPGEILQREFLAPLRLSQAALATRSGIPVRQIRALVRGERGVTRAIAKGLARALQTSQVFWTRLQAVYNRSSVLAQDARRKRDAHAQAQNA